MNTIGKNLRLTTFGESHGPAIGGVIDGFPSGFKINFEKLKLDLESRRPSSSNLVSQRNESDIPEFLSGISNEGITLGTPIGFIIRNNDTRSQDYEDLADIFRPNHADLTYQYKYGLRDYRGGGRASARETANWVVAGSLASQWLYTKGINIESKLTAVGKISYTNQIIKRLVTNPGDKQIPEIPEKIKSKMLSHVLEVKESGDSVGGIVTCLITGLTSGIGNPIFEKLHSQLSAAIMSINACKGFEYGYGFRSLEKLGSESLDIFQYNSDVGFFTSTNYSGGIQGGITNGMPVFFNAVFKPTPSIFKEVETVNQNGQPSILKLKGRHDPCVAMRAVPIVRAICALVVADFLL